MGGPRAGRGDQGRPPRPGALSPQAPLPHEIRPAALAPTGTPALFTCSRPPTMEKEMIRGLFLACKSQQSSQRLPHQSCLAGALSKEGPWFTSAQFSWDCSALRMLPCDCLTVSCLFYICLRLVRSALEPGTAASRVTLRHALFYFCNTRFPSLPCLVLCSQGSGSGEEGSGLPRTAQLLRKEPRPLQDQETIPGYLPVMF